MMMMMMINVMIMIISILIKMIQPKVAYHTIVIYQYSYFKIQIDHTFFSFFFTHRSESLHRESPWVYGDRPRWMIVAVWRAFLSCKLLWSLSPIFFSNQPGPEIGKQGRDHTCFAWIFLKHLLKWYRIKTNQELIRNQSDPGTFCKQDTVNGLIHPKLLDRLSDIRKSSKHPQSWVDRISRFVSDASAGTTKHHKSRCLDAIGGPLLGFFRNPMGPAPTLAGPKPYCSSIHRWSWIYVEVVIRSSVFC